jgi:outer membrane protein assembly factor BamE
MRLPSSLSLIAVLAVAALSSACSTYQTGKDRLFGLITPYRIDIVQGNVVTKEQAALIKPGMNRTQVRDILGSPMVADLFSGNRWDYIFTLQRQGTEPQRRHVVVMFDGELVKSLQAPELPSENEFVASIARPLTTSRSTPLALTPEQLRALPSPAQRPTPPSLEPQGAVRSYPPLEN